MPRESHRSRGRAKLCMGIEARGDPKGKSHRPRTRWPAIRHRGARPGQALEPDDNSLVALLRNPNSRFGRDHSSHRLRPKGFLKDDIGYYSAAAVDGPATVTGVLG